MTPQKPRDNKPLPNGWSQVIRMDHAPGGHPKRLRHHWEVGVDILNLLRFLVIAILQKPRDMSVAKVRTLPPQVGYLV